jgi:hypothetical protein
MTNTQDLDDKLEDGNMPDSNYYGMLPSIVGVLLGIAVISFMFAFADGFS